MSETLTGRVGPVYTADGVASQPIRQGRFSELVVGQVGGKYREATIRGNVYSAQTANTGVAPGATISTTGSFTLYNPKGSGKRLVVQKLWMGYVSGTLGAGLVAICTNNDATAAASTGTAITPVNRDVGSANNSVATPLTTSTLPAAPTPIGVLCSLDAFAGGGALTPFVVEKDIDGEIVIEPGCGLTLRGLAGAGTSPLVVFGATWEEVAL